MEFRRLTRRRLVILGPAGAGKTTLAVQLLLELLDTRTPDQPVPVLLSLAGWDTTTAPRLQDWLADRLAQDYPAVRAVDPAAPRVLVEQGFTLPVLDGLDELPDAHRPAVIRAINSSLGATDPLVLTCRTEEYRDAVGASEVLRAAAVIEPESLTRSEAANYLLTCLPTSPTRSIPARCWTMPTPRRCGRNCSTSSSLRSSGPGRPPVIPTTRCVRGAPTTCAAG